MSRQLLLVESNTTGTGRLFASRAADLGIEPVLITNNPSRYPFVAEDQVRFLTADTSDQASVLGLARRLAGDGEVAGVTSSSDYYIETAAACAEALGRPGPPAACVRACRDKATQREILRSSGVGGPAFARIRRQSEVFATGIKFPAIVKPVQGSGSVGVRLCADQEQAAEHAARLLRTQVNERGLPVPAEVLVEEYITGPEFSVEVFGGRAVAVVGKHLGPLPWCVEIGHDLPPEPGRGPEQLPGAAVDAVLALGLGFGAVHVELRLDSAGPRIIEVNPRLAGGMIPELVRLAHGVDLVGAQVRAVAGLGSDLTSRELGSAAIRFLTADTAGTVAAPEKAVAASLAVPGVVDAVIYRAVGEPVAPATDFKGRVGHVISFCERSGSAADIAERGLKLLGGAVRYGHRDGRS